MSIIYSVKEIQQDQHRRNLAIASLLNDVSVEPLGDESNKEILPWNEDVYSYEAESASPSCSSSTTTTSTSTSTTADESDTSKLSCSPVSNRSASPDDLWNYSHIYPVNNENITVSSISKAKRKKILPHQYKRLINMFDETDTPSSEIRAQLASELYMTNREVQVWFQNRRAKMNRRRAPQRANQAGFHLPVTHSARPKRASYYIATTVNKYHPPFKTASAIELLAFAAEMMRPEI